MKFAVVTLFPEMFAALTEQGVTGKAFKQGLAQLDVVNPRDFTADVHRTVDDRPYGGGPGMLMIPAPLIAAIEQAKSQLMLPGATERLGEDQGPKVIYVSPQGAVFDQERASSCVAAGQPLVFVAGRYEGVDERVIRSAVDEEWSLGDFVLSGGELPVMVMMDAIVRLLPGVLGHQLSAEQDSFMDGLLDCPHYTRPETYKGFKVPDVLLSGNHERIRRWRLQQSLGRTWLRRPDLLEKRGLSEEEASLLDAFKKEYTTSA